MRIIPVMDLMEGKVVHAVRGERNKYRPVKSVIVPVFRPVDVAKALINETMCREIYIADLDAIQKEDHNLHTISDLAEKLDITLWVDAGINDGISAERLKSAGAGKIIVGSETLSSIDQLDSIREAVPEEDIIFSVDISQGLVISESGSLKSADPISAIKIISDKAIDHFILLTLDMVGTGSGPDIKLMEMARKDFSGNVFIAGGGVQTPDHLYGLKEAGADAVLVATSLHRGWIRREDILEMNKNVVL